MGRGLFENKQSKWILSIYNIILDMNKRGEGNPNGTKVNCNNIKNIE